VIPGNIRKSPAADDRGFALLLTLMITAIITAVVVEFAYSVYVNTAALYNWEDSQKLSLAARSAMRLGSKIITEYAVQPPQSYPGFFEMSEKIPFDSIDGTITLRIEDENAKFNLQTLRSPLALGEDPYAAFLRLLNAIGLKADVADRISYWMNSDSTHRPVDTAGLSKNNYLDSVDELLLIPGIDSATYEKLRPYITIYGDTKINMNSASVPVIMSLSSSITRDIAERIVRYRESTPFSDSPDVSGIVGVTSQLSNSLAGYIRGRGSCFRVISTAGSGDLKRIMEIVIDATAGYRVVRYWKET
jgi:general secretion pathway protein K